jgi:ribosomal protein S18 acetylase RimI-like enzyme
MNKIKIRQYQETDFNRIQELNHSEGWTNLVEKDEDTKQAWRNSNVSFVVEAEGEGVVGYIRGLTDTRISLYICELLIDKKYRGLGIGKIYFSTSTVYTQKQEWKCLPPVHRIHFMKDKDIVLFMGLGKRWKNKVRSGFSEENFPH